MYRIGQFSSMTRVTIKALRFYEEEGLLAPARVDAANGYRYYSSSQLPRIHKIVALRQCGFSIPEIRTLLAGRNMGAIFAERKRILEEQAVETALQLSSINHYISSLREGNAMSYEVVIKELPRVTVFSKRMVVESYDSYFEEIPKIGEEILRVNPDLTCLEMPYCFIIYHEGEYKSHDIDVEYCEAVTRAGVETETIKFKVIDGVKQAACVLHKGRYADLPLAYAAVYKWIEDNKMFPADNPRESYIDGIWNCDSEDDWLTEVQVPVIPR